MLTVTVLGATEVQVEPDQYATFMIGLALVVLLLAVVAVSIWRRS